MHNRATVDQALALLSLGQNQCEVSRALGINRRTIGDWANGKLPAFDVRCSGQCIDHIYDGNPFAYLYLLGLYLGDGHISAGPRGVFKLRITCDSKYSALMDRCESAISEVMPLNVVGRVERTGCTDVYSYSKHWPCLFPQHGPGKKHDRLIQLEPWQQQLVDLDPRPLVEGLIHSDGCRVTNPIVNRKSGKQYEYPRYHFSNRSADIHQIFTHALDQLRIEWKRNNKMNISIARKNAVAKMDSFIMPKQ